MDDIARGRCADCARAVALLLTITAAPLEAATLVAVATKTAAHSAAADSAKFAPALVATLRLDGRFVGIGSRGAVIEVKTLPPFARLLELLPARDGFGSITLRPPRGGTDSITKLIVTLHAGVALPPLDATIGGLRVVNRYEPRRYIVVEAAQRVSATSLRDLAHDPGVEYVEPNYRYHLADTIPNDPGFASMPLWWFPHVHAPAAWDVVQECPHPIAIIDTGIDLVHPDLKDNLWRNPGEIAGNYLSDDGNGYVDDVYGYDFANGSADPQDHDGHGTPVAGLVAARGNNNTGIAGVCWRAHLIAIRAFKGEVTDLEQVIPAIDYAVGVGARVINASWNARYSDSPKLRQAIEDAGKSGALLSRQRATKAPIATRSTRPNTLPHSISTTSSPS
jgi:subtilisin family serine protease